MASLNGSDRAFCDPRATGSEARAPGSTVWPRRSYAGRLTGDRVQPPGAGYALQFVLAPVGELDAGPDYEVPQRA